MSIFDVMKLLGGVALLMYGIKTMGDALQDIAGDKLRRLIGSLTGTPIRGVAVGALVTVLIQSSSATTVMVVSFVHVGLMTLEQGFSVILGANVGTTITAQLIAFSIQRYAILAAVIGAVLFIVGKTRRTTQIGSGLVGFALLFIGMQMMQEPMGFLRDRADLFLAVNNYPLLGLLMGAGVTMLVQASSATVGLTMVMASQGLLELPSAVAIIMGDNIGTTITAVLASLGGNRAAKQAAAAHVFFNVLGACIMMLLLTPFSKLIALSAVDPARQVANAHTLFNVLNALIFLPFIKPYVAMIKKIIPDDKNAVVVEHGPMYLDEKLITVSPAAAVDAVRKELVRLGGITLGMLKDCREIVLQKEYKKIPDALMTEKTINELTHKIVKYATLVGPNIVSKDLLQLLNSFVSGTSDFERIGDHSENLIEMAQLLQERKQNFSAKAVTECEEMFALAIQAVEKCLLAMEKEDMLAAREVLELEPKIDQMEKVLRARHIERLNSGKCVPMAGVVFIDILSNLERVGDHARNLAFIVTDIHAIRVKQK